MLPGRLHRPNQDRPAGRVPSVIIDPLVLGTAVAERLGGFGAAFDRTAASLLPPRPSVRGDPAGALRAFVEGS